ncbi:MAG: DUF4070 domain-containing protein [Dehalococcoidia bacterium]|nr:DUF4070 domain-containing protein [Dehalococcoidia bacterium]
MKVLLVYPRYTDTFWSLKHALKFISKKAAFPPLGLLTVSAMLPTEWQQKLVDMNITNLTDKDIKWADYVLISGMIVQLKSTHEVIKRCNNLGIKTVIGGPMATLVPHEFDKLVTHMVLDEAETTMPLFLEDLKNGHAKHKYTAPLNVWPDVTKTPLPRWEYIDMNKYSSMCIQYSRGCPFNCEFCNVTLLNGHRPRTKSKEQLQEELEVLYQSGWRSMVFIVDDNFIGNKAKLKKEILPAMIEWMQFRGYPFSFFTEASINLADDDELMRMMTKAGFNTVFIGIETPNENSLEECHKVQNKGRDLVASVKKIQNYGLQVQGGFIVGFDHDPQSIFHDQINFIQKSGIVTAMVGMLMAPPGTRLYQRMEKEGRILPGGSGDNTDGTTNIIPKMGYETLHQGYKNIMDTIYSPKEHYKRIKTFLKEYHPPKRKGRSFSLPKFGDLKSLIKVSWSLGLKDRGRWRYWQFFTSTVLKRPKTIQISLSLAAYGYHFRKVADKMRNPPRVEVKQLQPQAVNAPRGTHSSSFDSSLK